MSTCGTCSKKGRCQDYVMYGEYCQAWVADEATTLRRKLETIKKAAAVLVHLHLCEQEGIENGQPTPEQWTEAVDNLAELLET